MPSLRVDVFLRSRRHSPFSPERACSHLLWFLLVIWRNPNQLKTLCFNQPKTRLADEI